MEIKDKIELTKLKLDALRFDLEISKSNIENTYKKKYAELLREILILIKNIEDGDVN